MDAVGNVVGVYHGSDPQARRLLTGSHYDTVRNAGKYDGRLGIFVPMALAGRLRMTRRAAPLVVIVALGEVLGNVVYIIGSRESIAVTAVLASQFAALAAVAAFVLFHERLSARQRSGFVAIAVGIAALTLVRG